MTDRLEPALAEIRRLPADKQDRLAAFLSRYARDPDAYDGDLRWDELLSDPKSEAVLERLAEEARQEMARGEIYDVETLCKR